MTNIERHTFSYYEVRLRECNRLSEYQTKENMKLREQIQKLKYENEHLTNMLNAYKAEYS